MHRSSSSHSLIAPPMDSQEREPACPHPCPRPCHLGECPPCKVPIRRSCHCGSMVHVFECLYYNSMSEKEQMTVRSCGRSCHMRSLIIVFGLETQPACPHPCPQPCHPGECPPCKVLIRRLCHCRSMVHVFECMSEKEQMTVRSCGGPCHRKLPYCTHLCPEICHPGQCPAPEKCSKKVTVRCGCQTLKKEWLCHEVQAAYHSARSDLKDISKNQYELGLLPCNSGCRSKVKVADTELQHRKSTVLKDKEADAENYVPKRRKRRERAKEAKQISRLQKFTAAMWRLLLFVTLVLALIAATYYGYKGLLWLSDWMNEVEVQRQRRRYP
ncbi:unnamed protein product [Camellia sinensis]